MMISNATQQTFAILSQVITAAKPVNKIWLTYSLINFFVSPLFFCYQVINGAATLALSIGVGNCLLNMVLLSVALNLLALLCMHVSNLLIGLLSGTILQVFSISKRPTILSVPLSILGMITGLAVTFVLGSKIIIGFAANPLHLYTLLASTLGNTTLLVLPAIIIGSIATYAFFDNTLRTKIKNAAEGIFPAIKLGLASGISVLGLATGHPYAIFLSISALGINDNTKFISGIGLSLAAPFISNYLFTLTAISVLFFNTRRGNLRNSLVILLLGALVGYFLLSAGLTLALLTLTFLATNTIASYTLATPISRVLIAATDAVKSFCFKDKRLSVRFLLNLERDNPLINQLLPFEAEIKKVVKVLRLKGYTFNLRDLTQNDQIQACLTHFKAREHREALRSLIRIGADYKDCLVGSHEETIAQKIIPLEGPVTGIVSFSSNSLLWLAAKVVAKHNIALPKDADPKFGDLLASVKSTL